MLKYSSFDSSPYGVHMKIIKLVGNGKKILEVGCATGKVSKRFLENDCEVIGIEIDQKSAEIANNYCKTVIIQDVEFIENFPYPNNYFDIIIFADVLEHLKFPLDVLIKFKKYVKEDGCIIVSLPNITNLLTRTNMLLGKFEYTDVGILDKTHLRFFTKNSAKKVMFEAGLEIISFDTVPILKGYNIGVKFLYLISQLWPNIFAHEFIIVGRKK